MSIIWTTGMDRMEAHFSKGQWPWRKVQKEIFREFCESLGKTNTAAVNAGMSPYRAGLGYVVNCEKSLNDLEKLEAAWEEFDQRKIQEAIAKELQAKTIHSATVEKPPVVDLDETKDRRIGVLKNMLATNREAEAKKLITENPDWGIDWNEVKR